MIQLSKRGLMAMTNIIKESKLKPDESQQIAQKSFSEGLSLIIVYMLN